MTRNVNDIHSYKTRLACVRKSVKELETSETNKKLVSKFITKCINKELKPSTITGYSNILIRMIRRLKEIGYDGDLDKIDIDTFEELVAYLHECNLSKGEIRNHKKVTRKFYQVISQDKNDIPSWVLDIKLGNIITNIQPNDILNSEEINNILQKASSPRNKAMIAVLLDGGVRVGALGSFKIKNLVDNGYAKSLHFSSESECKKTDEVREIPLTWSIAYLDQWLAFHPKRNDPESPLFVTADKNSEALSYNAIRVILKKEARNAGIVKRVNPHLFRHTAITNWILDGLTEQQIKHRAAWSRGSIQLFKIYGNFTSGAMNKSIYQKYGIATKKEDSSILKKCPRCGSLLQSSELLCVKCGLPMSLKAYDLKDDLKPYEKNIPEFLELIINNKVINEIVNAQC